MLRSALAALCLALAGPLPAASIDGALSLALTDTAVAVTRVDGPDRVVYDFRRAVTLPSPCRVARGTPVRLWVTIDDDEGIDFAGVRFGALAVRPTVPDHVATYLWIEPAARDDRAYQWRFETEGRLPTRITIPVAIDIVGSPLELDVEVKDGAGQIFHVTSLLSATTVACR